MGRTHWSGPLLYSGADAPRKWFRELPLDKNPDYVVFMDDFTGVAQDQTNDWTVVKDTGASVAIQADTVGGRLLMSSTATTENDGSSIQGNEIFKAVASNYTWFEVRIASSDADQQDVFVGLTENFATNPEAVLTASNRIGFQIDDGNASILCKTEATDTETSTDSGVDAADATMVKLGFLVDGTGNVEFYVNRALVATHTTNIPTTELAPAVFQLSGDTTGTKTLTVDYVFVAATRQ